MRSRAPILVLVLAAAGCAQPEVEPTSPPHPASRVGESLQREAPEAPPAPDRAELQVEVERSWHAWTRRFADHASELPDYDAALTYLDGPMADDILAAVAADLRALAPEMELREVRALWEERPRETVRSASYGEGTWLLGELGARAGVPGAAPQAPPVSSDRDEAREEIEAKIERYLKDKEVARRAKADADTDGADPAAFWSRWPPARRAEWIRAFHVEHGGDFQVESASVDDCRGCAGTGTCSVTFAGGGGRIVPCPTCHHVAVVRSVRYR